MTPRELLIRAEARAKQQERAMYALAWLACHFPLAMGVKKGKKLTPEKLLGKKPARRAVTDLDEFAQPKRQITRDD